MPFASRIAAVLVVASAFAASGFASAAPAGAFEMRFQFDQHGTPSMHTFVLKWGAETANLQSIDVVVSDTKEVIQTIPVPQDKVKLIYKDLVNNPPSTIKDQFIDSLDFNFDKFADLRLTRDWPYKVGAKYYLVFLFDEEKNQYVLNDAISELQGPVPNPKTQRIESVTLGGFGGGEFVKRAYSINEKGKLKVQMKISQHIQDAAKLLFIRDVRVRTAGELQRVCKMEVPGEGKPKKLWGHKDLCLPYMEKEIY